VGAPAGPATILAMATELTDKARDLLRARTFGMLGIVMANGEPQVTPVWVDLRDDRPMFNTAVGRPKERQMRRDPRVCLTLMDGDAYSYVEIRGTVEFVEGPSAEADIDLLAKKYLDRDVYPWRDPAERRVTLLLTPTRIMGMDE